MNSYIRTIGPALVFLLIILILQIIWVVFDLPDKNDLLKIAQIVFQDYGVLVFFLVAVVEGLLLIGWYFPGGTVLFVGVILAGNDLASVLLNGLIISFALLLAYVLNYFIGFYGWHKLFIKFGLGEPLAKVQKKLSRSSSLGFFLTYWHPSTAALSSTAAGLLKLNFVKFFINSAVSLLIWNSIWGFLIYNLGEKALNIISFKFVFIVLLLWIFFKLLHLYSLRRTQINN